MWAHGDQQHRASETSGRRRGVCSIRGAKGIRGIRDSRGPRGTRCQRGVWCDGMVEVVNVGSLVAQWVTNGRCWRGPVASSPITCRKVGQQPCALPAPPLRSKARAVASQGRHRQGAGAGAVIERGQWQCSSFSSNLGQSSYCSHNILISSILSVFESNHFVSLPRPFPPRIRCSCHHYHHARGLQEHSPLRRCPHLRPANALCRREVCQVRLKATASHQQH